MTDSINVDGELGNINPYMLRMYKEYARDNALFLLTEVNPHTMWVDNERTYNTKTVMLCISKGFTKDLVISNSFITLETFIAGASYKLKIDIMDLKGIVLVHNLEEIEHMDAPMINWHIKQESNILVFPK